MATNIIMPALEMTQESGTLVSWLKREGESVTKGEPIMEIETDKVTIEIEATASGILGGVLVQAGDVVPVGQTIAWILAPGETPPPAASVDLPSGRGVSAPAHTDSKPQPAKSNVIEASPLARNVAEEHGIDLASIKPSGHRIEKADVLAYIQSQSPAQAAPAIRGKILASPKARRLASERGIDLSTVAGSGPEGVVLAADVPQQVVASTSLETPSTVWRVMAERMSASWTTVPHFYLTREVEATRLIEWRKQVISLVEKRTGIKPTFTDLLVKLIGFTLRNHPRLNAAWMNGKIQFNQSINVGIATALEDGLIVPVIRGADSASVSEIAAQRRGLIERAQSRKLRPADISDGTFTLSNLGMYNIDSFSAIVNTPQAAILAVGRIAERVVPLNGQVAVRSMMNLTLSCDHRVADGARGAQFLDDLANLIEDPLGLLV